MALVERKQQGGHADVELPSVAYTKSGLSYDPRADVWDWFDGPFHVLIGFDALPENFRQFEPQLKSCLMVFVKGYSPVYASNLFGTFVHFARANPALEASEGVITSHEVATYGASLDKPSAWRVTTLNPLLQKWHELGLDGVDEACANYLRGRRKPGNTKGAAVRTRDGPTS